MIVTYLAIATNEAPFVIVAVTKGHFLCGVERVKRFVNVSLHCIISNLKTISKMPTLSPPGKFSVDAHEHYVSSVLKSYTKQAAQSADSSQAYSKPRACNCCFKRF